MHHDLTKKKVGRPSSLDDKDSCYTKKAGSYCSFLPLNIRKDDIRHRTDMVVTRGLCRNGRCKGNPYLICTQYSTGVVVMAILLGSVLKVIVYRQGVTSI